VLSLVSSNSDICETDGPGGKAGQSSSVAMSADTVESTTAVSWGNDSDEVGHPRAVVSTKTPSMALEG